MKTNLLIAIVFVCCAHSTLSPAQATHLAQPTELWGTRIYLGTVTPAGAGTPAFTYERRVRDNTDGTRVSTHVTFKGTTPIVVQQATQDATGRLLGYHEVHGQRGEAYDSEGGNFVVGPTLFEYVRAHLSELRAGQTVPLEFWDRGSQYGFVLSLKGTQVEMRAASFVVGLGIAPMTFQLGTNDEITSYHGRIPPLVDGRSVDAETSYEYFVPFR